MVVKLLLGDVAECRAVSTSPGSGSVFLVFRLIGWLGSRKYGRTQRTQPRWISFLQRQLHARRRGGRLAEVTTVYDSASRSWILGLGRSRAFRASVRIFVAVGLLALGASVASADETIDLGVVSFDTLNPGATDAFTVFNFTGVNSLPPEFPVITDLTFLGATLTITDTTTSTTSTNSIGDQPPASSQLAVLASDSYSEADFQATLSQTTFGLSDGTTFQANSNVVSLALLPSSPPSLQADADFAFITVSGSIVTAPAPESPTWLLLLTAMICIAVRKRTGQPSHS